MNRTEHFYQDDSKFSSKNWFTAETLFQRAIINAPNPAQFVELGTHRGRSAAYMAVEIARSNKRIHLWTIDVNQTLTDAAIENLVDHPCVSITHGDATQFANVFEDASVDFLFMDANKEYEKLLADFDAWLPKMRIGSVIAGNDYWWTDALAPIIDPDVPKFGQWSMRRTFPVARAVHERFPEYELIVTKNWAKWWVVLK